MKTSTDTICEALRTDILAHGVPSATLGAFEDIVRQEVLLDAKAAIKLDKDTFAGVGRDTKGHARALMLIDEILNGK